MSNSTKLNFTQSATFHLVRLLSKSKSLPENIVMSSYTMAPSYV